LTAAGIEAWEHRAIIALILAIGLDDVGAGLALDRQDDGPLLVEPGGKSLGLSRADGLADIAYRTGEPIAIGESPIGLFFRWNIDRGIDG